MIQYYVACTSCGGRGFTPAPMPVGDGARALARAEIILEATSVVYGVPVDMIRSKSQKAYVVEARDEACYRIRQETDLTLGAIARAVGRTDHSTIISAIKRHERRLDAGKHQPDGRDPNTAVVSGFRDRVARRRVAPPEARESAKNVEPHPDTAKTPLGQLWPARRAESVAV